MTKKIIIVLLILSLFILSSCTEEASSTTTLNDITTTLNDITTTLNDITTTMSSSTTSTKTHAQEEITTTSKDNSLIELLEHLVSDIKKQINELIIETEELGSHNNELTTQIGSLETQINNLKEQNTALSNRSLEIIDKIEELNNETSEYNNQISELKNQTLELLEQTNNLNDMYKHLGDKLYVGLNYTYNEIGMFYEKDVDDMIECSHYNYNSGRSSLGAPILLDFPYDNDVYFIIKAERGKFIAGTHWQIQNEKELVLNPESLIWHLDDIEYHPDVVFWWRPDGPITSDFIQIIIMKEDIIVGYAVIKIQEYSSTSSGTFAVLLKSAIIPTIKGETVTKKQVQTAINSIITENRKIEWSLPNTSN